MKKCGIYKITNIVNNKMLIGQSEHMCRRWNEHKSLLRKNKHKNPHLQAAWNKYGEQNFTFTVMVECTSEKLDEKEIMLIKDYDTMNKEKGYNIEPGGGHPKMSEETKQKISMANKGRGLGKHHSEETKLKMRESHLGPNNCMYGKHFSEEIIQKRTETRKKNYRIENHPMFGKSMSEESKENNRIWHLGKHPSKETKEKMSMAKYGKNNPNYGKPYSKERLNKMSEIARRDWAKRKFQLSFYPSASQT